MTNDTRSSGIDLWLDKIGGMCRFCDKPLGESPPPACGECTVVENRRITRIKESNPYKKVWNTAEDEEAILLEWVKNGTLFAPTNEELARRHMSDARFLLRKVKKLGKTTESISVFNEALFHWNMAKDYLDKHQEIVVKSR